MQSHSNRRFVTVTAVSMAIFLLFSLVLRWAEETDAVSTPLLWIGSILPIAALLTPLWALWRYLWEIDEYLRSIQLKAIFFGLTVLLLLASAWGYFELFVDAAGIPMFWLNPIYWAAYSIGALYFSRLEGREA
ncbi:hypothetical protein VE25_18655 [Devosia geojensis]|uniref:Transmembrane protein n=1 Tax=Devosia geojensis TaxID=443610 RepID=A0A0F5FK08_9HYPH|nr:hypothetical protein [Devosia geojensis]KKB08532.1 hypothetical protein VE25_18655 [Devosia geojensis]